MKPSALLALFLTALTAPLPAQDGKSAAAEVKPASQKLAAGSPAPDFKPAQWLKGEPVTAFDKDKTYLIECWATWCGPCVAAIPHINELHNKYKDKGLVVIGMDVWEQTSTKAEAFVKGKGDGMAYRVAFAEGDTGTFSKLWLEAVGIQGIPHTFIVQDQKLLWQGSP